MFLVAMTFIIAAGLHPQESTAFLPVLIYYLLIPSMYLLLSIYSITNLNVVSWGTREVAQKKSKKEIEAEKVIVAESTPEKSTTLRKYFGWLENIFNRQQKPKEEIIQMEENNESIPLEGINSKEIVSAPQLRDDLKNPFWIEDQRLPKFNKECLSEKEIGFWNELIQKYLHPIDANKKREASFDLNLAELNSTNYNFHLKLSKIWNL